MKKILLLLSIIFITSLDIYSQTFTCTIQNQLASGTDFDFDIYMLRTGGTEIFLGNSDFVVTFDNANFTGPTYVIIQLGDIGSNLNTFYGSGTSIASSNRAILNINQPAFGTQIEFDNRVQIISNSGFGTHIAHVRITGISNLGGSANIQWRTASPNNTSISTLANSSPWNAIVISSNGTYINPSDAPLPIELSKFAVESNGRDINLIWQTRIEIDNYGFEVERAALNPKFDLPAETSVKTEIRNPKFEKIGFVPGSGNSNSPKDYSFADNNPSGGSRFVYRLKQVDTDGKFQYSNEVAVDFLPQKFALFQNYPNPFNPSTTIKFAVPKAGNLNLSVYSLLGEKIKDLYTGFKEPGIYDFEFNGRDLGSGTYIYRLQADDFVQVRKMMLIK